MNIKLYKYLLLSVAVVLLISCVDAQKKDMSGGDNADTKEETFPNFIYHSYLCFGQDCEEAIITGIAKDSIHLYKDIVGIQTDSIIKTNSEKILNPFIHLTYIDNTDDSYPFNGFEGTIIFSRDARPKHQFCRDSIWFDLMCLPYIANRNIIEY